jgi:hypothetical protein
MALTKRQELTRLTVAETEFRLATTILVNSVANLERVIGMTESDEAGEALQVIQRTGAKIRRMVIDLENEIDSELSDL